MIQRFQGHSPRLHSAARIAENAVLVGQVTVDARASIWYGAVLRADNGPVAIGANSNIQENAVCHCDAGAPVRVGRNVTVGHGAILHGCTVEDGALIGMGAILLNGCVIGAGSMVAAGALVPQGAVIPPGSLAIGSPAKVTRPLRPEEAAGLLHSAEHYAQLAAELLPAAAPAGDEIPPA